MTGYRCLKQIRALSVDVFLFSLCFLCTDKSNEVLEQEKKEEDGEQQWLTVYTDYGYGVVDAKQFLVQTEECQQ